MNVARCLTCCAVIIANTSTAPSANATPQEGLRASPQLMPGLTPSKSKRFDLRAFDSARISIRYHTKYGFETRSLNTRDGVIITVTKVDQMKMAYRCGLRVGDEVLQSKSKNDSLILDVRRDDEILRVLVLGPKIADAEKQGVSQNPKTLVPPTVTVSANQAEQSFKSLSAKPDKSNSHFLKGSALNKAVVAPQSDVLKGFLDAMNSIKLPSMETLFPQRAAQPPVPKLLQLNSGELYEGGVSSCPGKFTVVFNRDNTGKIRSGMYRHDAPMNIVTKSGYRGPYTGTLDGGHDLKPDAGDASGSARVAFNWRDPHGQGTQWCLFSKDGKTFTGKWTASDGSIWSWWGTRVTGAK